MDALPYLHLAPDGTFKAISSPLPASAEEWDAELSAAGYWQEISSNLGEGPTVDLYMTDKPGLPKFLVDVCGGGRQIAILCADDAAHLANTLKAASGLIQLVQASQPAIAAALEPERNLRRGHPKP